MTKPFEEWTVLPHGKLTQIDDGLLTVVGELPMPVGDFPRRMTVARLDDGRLVVYSAIALHEDEMAQLERYGRPAVLVVPNQIHRLDAKIWKQRYPEMKVICPEGARAKVDEIVHVDACDVDLGDSQVHYATVRGTGGSEAALVVQRPVGTTLVVNDIIWNVDHMRGAGGWLLKVAGFTGEDPKIPALVAFKAIKDKGAFREQLNQWAGLRNLKRIIVSHGEIVTHEARSVLQELALRIAA